MFFLRLFLGFAVGYCIGNATRIGVEVSRRGTWSERDTEECLYYLIGAVFLGMTHLLSYL